MRVKGKYLKKRKTLFVSLYAFLLGAWAEVRLKKLLHEINILSKSEREDILYNQNTYECSECHAVKLGRKTDKKQFEQWNSLIEFGFRQHCGIADISMLATPFKEQYDTLKNILDDYLKDVIEVRNKLAHGQWIEPLNNKGNDINQELKDALDAENILSLKIKQKLILRLADIIHDLIVSSPTFDRDFTKHYKRLIENQQSLENRKYAKYEQLIIDKKRKGVEKQKSSMGLNKNENTV